MKMNNDPLMVFGRTMESIKSKIQGNVVLGKLSEASEEEIFYLKEEFGEDAVNIGIKIVEAYKILENVLSEIQVKS